MATSPLIARPPGPWNPPVVGHLSAFRKDPPRFLSKMRSEYGRAVFYKLGPQRVFFFSEPDLIKEVLINQQYSFVKSRVLQRAKVLLGEGLLTSEVPLHTRQRRLVQPAFHRQRMAGYAATMIECTARARERWSDGQTIDMAAEMMRLTLAIVAKTLFNADVEKESGRIGEALTAVLHLFDLVMTPFSELIEKLPLPAMKRFRAAKATLDDTIYRIIRERRTNGEDTGDLLSMLLLAQDEDGAGGGMSDQQIRDEALTIFLAGHETTANALTWTWYLLSQNPAVEGRFQEELRQVLNGRLPEPDDYPKLRYTEMVFAEALRLYPPAWGVGRMAKQPVTVGGYPIAAGDIVIMSPYVVHRDPEWYPEPERFDPERWQTEARAARPKFAYFPFGGGARVCIGEHFAWTEGVLLLATIGQRFQFRLAADQPVDYRALITLRPKSGMRMTVSERSR